jgi:N6-adenosine-specific RNA methylase IME4
MWATAPMMPQAVLVMGAWGFDYKSQVMWRKLRAGDGRGTGYWFINEHELLLVGTRGNVPAPAPGTQWKSVIKAPVGEHSEKPEIFAQMIEEYFPTMTKIELNRRGPPRPNWSVWGFEAEESSPATD